MTGNVEQSHYETVFVLEDDVYPSPIFAEKGRALAGGDITVDKDLHFSSSLDFKYEQSGRVLDY